MKVTTRINELEVTKNRSKMLKKTHVRFLLLEVTAYHRNMFLASVWEKNLVG